VRIAIVNDMALVLEFLRQIVIKAGGNKVAWVAWNGAEAVEKCARDTPDLILMDLIMPVMDGVEATRQIMTKSPCPILVVTAAMDGNTAKVFEAMGHGALDAINTPVMGNDAAAQQSRKALLKRIETIGKLNRQSAISPHQRLTWPVIPKNLPPLIVIGSSTGGPKALAAVLSRLPGHLRAGIIVVQHVGGEFSEGLADWLNVQTDLNVRLASEGRMPALATVFFGGEQRSPDFHPGSHSCIHHGTAQYPFSTLSGCIF